HPGVRVHTQRGLPRRLLSLRDRRGFLAVGAAGSARPGVDARGPFEAPGTAPAVPGPAAPRPVYFRHRPVAENPARQPPIARRLPRYCPVLYVDSPGLRAPRATGRDLRRLAAKMRQALRRPTLLAPQLWHCTIPQIPFRLAPGVETVNRRFGRWAARRAI